MVMVRPALGDVLNTVLTSDSAALSLLKLLVLVHWPDSDCMVRSYSSHDLTPVKL